MFWDAVLDGPIAALVLSGRENQAEALLMSQLDDDMNRQSENSESLIQNCEPAFNRKNCKGFVWIVGAGPGQYVCLRQYY